MMNDVFVSTIGLRTWLGLALIMAGGAVDPASPPQSDPAPVAQNEPEAHVQRAGAFVETKLTAVDGGRNEEFGRKVSVDGRRVAVVGGGPAYFGRSAYVYEFNGVSYTETRLPPADDQMGWRSVSLKGDQIILGAGGDVGRPVWLYRLEGSTWVKQTLVPGDGAPGNLYGLSVAQDGDRIVVGSPSLDLENPGSVYVYERDGTSWSETKLTASDGRAGDLFGYSVSTSGDRIVVGNYDGAAYLYDFDGTEWSETKLAHPEPGAFGFAVSVDGDRIVVGDFNDDDVAGNAGAVFVYELRDASWRETKLTASDGAAGDRFGRSVAVEGDRIVVGAHHSDAGGSYSGSVYVFDRNETGWAETKLVASDLAEEDTFGQSVAIAGGRIVVGSPGDDDLGEKSGAAYVYLDTSTIAVERRGDPHSGAHLVSVPNPVRSQAAITFSLGAPTSVRISVVDLLGREVSTVVDEVRPSGRHVAIVDVRGLASGLYFYVLQTPTFVETRSMTVIR